ncbi:MAG: hypothetical protein ACJ73D_03270 [Pyrinomonadaceae bacterium]
MFCPKCGSQNPDQGVFCRACGMRLSNATAPIGVGAVARVDKLVGRRGRPISYESAAAKLFTGLAFVIIACILGWTGNGHGWWFWMLIPGFASLGKGFAQMMQIRSAGRGGGFVSPTIAPEDRDHSVSAGAAPNLPPAQQQWPSAESRYKTGDLVPPSVTETTTRHLDLNKEGQTMTLPPDKT